MVGAWAWLPDIDSGQAEGTKEPRPTRSPARAQGTPSAPNLRGEPPAAAEQQDTRPTGGSRA